jgi:hypothetical protein
MDSNVSLLIHNKHMQHKILQKEIKPHIPKTPKIPKKKGHRRIRKKNSYSKYWSLSR